MVEWSNQKFVGPSLPIYGLATPLDFNFFWIRHSVIIEKSLRCNLLPRVLGIRLSKARRNELRKPRRIFFQNQQSNFCKYTCLKIPSVIQYHKDRRFCWKKIYSQVRGPSEKQEKEEKDYPGSPGGSVVAMREHQVAKNSFPDLAPEISRTVPKACVIKIELVVIPVKWTGQWSLCSSILISILSSVL